MLRFKQTRCLTPLFNTPTWQHVWELDRGLWRPLETLLPRSTPVEIVRSIEEGVYEIKTPAYSSQTPLYTAPSFLKSGKASSWRIPPLPPLSLFLSRIRWCVEQQVPYIWGGNAPRGCKALLSIPQIGKGVDCSGLIYWASGYATARNTSELIYAGEGVAIQGLSPEQLVDKLQPGMLIVWKGHVLVITPQGIVESTPERGVHCHLPLQKIQELMRTRTPLDTWDDAHPQSFLIRSLFRCNSLPIDCFSLSRLERA